MHLPGRHYPEPYDHPGRLGVSGPHDTHKFRLPYFFSDGARKIYHLLPSSVRGKSALPHVFLS